jgi:DnaK suppressor protein
MDDDRARELLAEARSNAEELLAGLERGDAGDDQDTGDSGGELQAEGVDNTRIEDLRDQLAGIERAEARLAAGEYGKSVDSGDAIPDGRLEIVPWAERTVAEEERRGR